MPSPTPIATTGMLEFLGQRHRCLAGAAVDALVVTKLDGSAKGGVLVALAEKFKLPVVAIGVGEGIDDLQAIRSAGLCARNLMGARMSEGATPEEGMRRLYATALELGPLLLFFAANAAGASSSAPAPDRRHRVCLPCYRWMEERWPVMPLVGGFFVLVFGGLTIWLQDDTFIKLKPTIVNCLFGFILGGGCASESASAEADLRRGVPADRRGLVEAHRALDAVLLRAGRRQRVVVARLLDGHLDRQQDVCELPATLVFAFLQIPLLRRHWHGDDNPFASGK